VLLLDVERAMKRGESDQSLEGKEHCQEGRSTAMREGATQRGIVIQERPTQRAESSDSTI
jgi:hypothetical protein